MNSTDHERRIFGSCSPTRTRRSCAGWTTCSRTRPRGHAVRGLRARGGRADRARGPGPGVRRASHGDDEHALALIAETVEYAAGPVIALLARRRGSSSSRARPSTGSPRYVESSDPEACRARSRSRCGATARSERCTSRSRSSSARWSGGGHRARQGHPHGAPRRRRARGVRAAARRTRARAAAGSSTSRSAVLDGHALLPKRPSADAHRARPRARRLQARLRALPGRTRSPQRRGADVLLAAVAVPGAAVLRGPARRLRPAGADQRRRRLPARRGRAADDGRRRDGGAGVRPGAARHRVGGADHRPRDRR